jgi:dTDP-4-dehydrorhamnose reductase
MNWAVIGDRGMFGADLVEQLQLAGQSVMGFNRENLDLSKDIDSLAQQIRSADIIVNAVGYTAVDRAESEPEAAAIVNADYAQKLALVAKKLGSRYFHISTDYVFEGLTSKPYGVNAPTNPQTAYGKSKLLGENLVLESGADCVVFRTSWLYGKSGECFPKRIARQLNEQGAAKVVHDQIGSPTWTKDLAEVVIQHGAHNFNERIVHASAAGSVSWFGFAREIAQSMPNGDQYFIGSVATEEFEAIAKRPAFSVLDNSETSGPIIGPWEERWHVAATEVLAEYL